METVKKVIMGIDPGTNVTGYGAVEVDGASVRMLAMGCIDLRRYDNPYEKLRYLGSRVAMLVRAYKPAEVAFEAPFHGENVQSMLKLGRAQGAAMAAALMEGAQVCEYAPRRVKQVITGNGAASKEQVARMLQRVFSLPDIPDKLDATDGLAVALCHHYESQKKALTGAVGGAGVKNFSGGKNRSGGASWADFIRNNPEKVSKK